jgi:hypothetical protein
VPNVRAPKTGVLAKRQARKRDAQSEGATHGGRPCGTQEQVTEETLMEIRREKLYFHVVTSYVDPDGIDHREEVSFCIYPEDRAETLILRTKMQHVVTMGAQVKALVTRPATEAA